MAKRPKLADLKRVCPQELSHCEGYTWHIGSKIGKGSFGEVYLGWNKAGTQEVAVKVVRRDFFKQDPKVRENLDREIRILKLLRGCEYVVQLYHVQEMKPYIVLVMELCEYDLDHLVKVSPFKEEDIVIFLHQLAKGMKSLREQNIVHRDLKPGNILIKHHPHTKKMLIKLADFGFARHFKDEGMKPIDMTSLAGTPVFMAPEALSCVFHPGKHYDDKVDIWSIGALLYKVIVGQCGFYAQLQDIPRILRHKGDAIAFERVAHSRKINYIQELPPSVNSRLSEPFRAKMNELLKEMLRLDATERMTFPQFFERVDDIITSKIEIVNLLHGTSYKFINDPNLTAEDIVTTASSEYHIPSKFLILFSTKSRHYITGQTTISQPHFAELLNDAGGTEGHALLYLLPVTQLSPDKVISDFSCLAPLKNELNDPNSFVKLIHEHKFSEEIGGMVRLMQAQQRRQLEGLDEFYQFCSREISTFTANVFRQFAEVGHQAVAKAHLAIQWLQDDLRSLSGKAQRSQLPALYNAVAQHKERIDYIVAEGASFGATPPPNLSIDVKVEELDKRSTYIVDKTKKFMTLTRDQIIQVGQGINEDCQRQIDEVTAKVRDQLRPLYEHLNTVWGIGQKLQQLQKHCSELDQLLTQIAQERSLVLTSLSAGTPVGETHLQRGSPVGGSAPNVVVVPPAGFPRPPPPTSPAGGGYYANTPPAGQQEVETLRRQRDDLNSKLSLKDQELVKLNAEVSSLKGQLATRHRNSSSGGDELEKTIVAGATAASNGRLSPSAALEGTSWTPPDQRLFQELAHKLNLFCHTADKLPGMEGTLASMQLQPPSPQQQRPDKDVSMASGSLYPDLLDYTIISMPDKQAGLAKGPSDQDLLTLIPKAKQLSELLQTNVTTLESLVMKSAKGTLTISNDHALIKIGRPAEYDEGDIVLFHPVKLSHATAPAVLHLERPKPYIFMDHSAYAAFNIRPGRMPDLFLGRLTEKPRWLNLEDHPQIATDIQERTGYFFRVKAEPTDLKFSIPPASTAPIRPPPPSNPAPQSSKTGKSDSSNEGRGMRGFFKHKHGGSGSKGGFV